MSPTPRLPTLAAFAAALLATAPAFGQDAPVEVTFWHMEQPPQRVARIQELIDAFNAANPDVVVRQEPQSWGEVYAKAPAAVAAGNAPDLLFAIPDFTTVMKGIGAVQPVDDFVARMDQEHDFYDAAVEPYTYEGHVWAVPLYNMALSLWYRKDALAQAGLEPPKTWDEWRAAAEALSNDERYGIGLPANRQLYTDQTVYATMVNGGASEIYNADGSLRFDNPQTVEAYRLYGDLSKFSPPDSPSWTWGEAEACFASGGCGMVLQFTVVSTYDTQAEGDPANLGVAAVPHAEGAEDPGTIAYVNGVMMLTDDPAKQAAAERFLAFLLEPENYGRFLTMEPALFLPVTADGAEASTFWDDPLVVKYREQVETMLDNSTRGRLFGFTGGHVFPSIGAISAQNLLAQVLQRVVVDGEDPAAAVTWGQEQMTQAIQ